jgi:anti-anti-sigma factor
MENLVIHQLDGQRRLRLAGELDMHSVHALNEALAGMSGGGQATLDLSDLTFIDSSGLHAIVAFARNENGNGRLILEGVSTMMVRLFEITDLTEHPNLDIRTAADVD